MICQCHHVMYAALHYHGQTGATKCKYILVILESIYATPFETGTRTFGVDLIEGIKSHIYSNESMKKITNISSHADLA